MAGSKITHASLESQREVKAESAAAINTAAGAQLVAAERKRKELLQVYRNEPKEDRYLSPMYRPYFGNVMQIMINGISIFFKVDGTTQKIPRTFADELDRRRQAVDNIISKQVRMSDIPANNESSPGELNLF